MKLHNTTVSVLVQYQAPIAANANIEPDLKVFIDAINANIETCNSLEKLSTTVLNAVADARLQKKGV
jgi:hypothetical protein